ncbi:2713_t:CDS:10 [Dentiscutata erythropus]|uniref:2713_t:CDS:1 n=1 Tax=Dentiscutata erythropus TaxID=1348616 RepID=A0A9N9FA43_9GLOM|nr:2713_t:CDS:10 [Dentiscutata erythropus]
MSFRDKINFYSVLDRLIPPEILNQDYDKDYLARRNLLQARAVVIVTVSVCFALILQLLMDLYLILLNGSINKSEFPWPITLLGTTLYIGFQTLSHANFFAVPPFGSIGKEIPISLSATGWVAYEQEFQYNQERMQKSLDEARSAETAKSMFISNVSHGILATVEILSNTKLNESQRALLNAIESCGTNLISVVNQIKFTDKGSVELTAVEITDETESKKDNVKKILSSLLPESENSDSSESDPETPIVKFRVEVIDTGRGIDPDFMNHMCQPFSQEDSSLRRKFEGTGLGLSIVKGLLDMMYSRLEVESSLGVGSKFSFVLELPLSQKWESLAPSQLPFDHQYLKLPPEEQNRLTSHSQSLSFAVLQSENTLYLRRITSYLDQWGFKYRVIKKEDLKAECEKEHADIVILNDSIGDLEWFLDEFVQFYGPMKSSNEGGEKSVKREHKDEKKQRILFFSTIEDYQNAQNALQKYKVQFAVVISKPAGPVKILTGIIKVIESLLSPTSENICVIKEEPAVCNYSQAQEVYLGGELLFSSSIYGLAADKTEEFPISVSSEKALVNPVYSTDDDTKRTEPTGVQSIEEQSSTVEKSEGKKAHLTKGKEKEANEKTLKDISFLIVEDNKVNAMILKTMLKQTGFNNYDVAINGLEAVQKFSKKLYDIIFMDLQMPICDGIEATKEIRKIENGEESYLITETPISSDILLTSTDRKRRKKAIIIAMTGLASEEDSEAAEAAGCNEFLTKPVSIKTLNSRMECWTRDVLESDKRDVITEEAKPQEEKEQQYPQMEEEKLDQPQKEMETKSESQQQPLGPI